MSEIKAVIFDCFGVLVGDVLRMKAVELEHTHPEAAKQIHAALRAGDRGIISSDEVATIVGDAIGVSAEEVRMMAREGEVKNTTLIAELPAIRKDYKLGMLSNISGRAALDEHFGPGRLDVMFDTVVASGEVGLIKPEPEIFWIAAERLGLTPKQCVMIDDLDVNIDGARLAGMKAIKFETNKQVLADLHELLGK